MKHSQVLILPAKDLQEYIKGGKFYFIHVTVIDRRWKCEMVKDLRSRLLTAAYRLANMKMEECFYCRMMPIFLGLMLEFLEIGKI